MKSLILNLPEDLDLNENDLLIYFASKLYEDRKLSAGQAADFAGLSKRTFIEIAGKYGISIFSNSSDDLYNDIKNA